MTPLFFGNPPLNPLNFPLSRFSSKSLTLFSPTKPSSFPLPFSPSFPNLISPHSSSFDQIIPYLQSEWKPIAKGWICSAISVTCLFFILPKSANLLDLLKQSRSDLISSEAIVLAVLSFSCSVSTYLQEAFLWEAALGAAFGIRVYVFGRVVERDLSFFEGSLGIEAGDLAHRLATEASDVAVMVYSVLNSVVPSTLQLLVIAIQMVVLSPHLTLVSALGLPCLFFIVGYLGERLRGISRRAHLTVATLSSYLNEVFPLMLVVKANNGEMKENLNFYRIAHEDLTALLRKKKMKTLIPHIMQVAYIAGLVVLYAISWIVSRGSMDEPRLLSFIVSLALLRNPIQSMGNAFNELKDGEPAVERLFNLARFDNKEETNINVKICEISMVLECKIVHSIKDIHISHNDGEGKPRKGKVVEKPNAIDLCNVTGDIKFSGVKFRYGGDDMPLILNEVDLHVKPGERVAFIGRSGGGKTTIIKLLIRLYDPLYGDIYLDDHNIQEVKLRSLRDHIVMVPQDTMLFSGTVAENIGYKDASGIVNNECVENAARIANADEFIRDLPQGYQTNIGPKGSLLSGGQRQRIAIARALYQKSSILILDEATSALDSKSELLVRQALERLMENHTVLIIAHRLETMMMADRILLVEGGKVEEVSKSSLLSPDGHLASILNSFVDTRRTMD